MSDHDRSEELNADDKAAAFLKKLKNGRCSRSKKLEGNPIIGISVRSSEVRDEDLRLFGGLAHLKKLDLSYTKLTTEGIKHMAPLPQLEQLDLYGTNIDDEAMKVVATFTNLKTLTTTSNLTATGLAYLAPLRKLHTLLHPVDDEQLRVAVELGLLHRLSQAKTIDGGRPKTLQEIQELDLGRTQVTGEGLKHLAPVTNLEDLVLIRTQVQDSCLEHLAPFTKLKSLYLDGTGVGDAGLKHLAPLTSLRTLFLTGNEITDEGLKLLATFTHLEYLDVNCDTVTAEGIQELQKALPNCRGITNDS